MCNRPYCTCPDYDALLAERDALKIENDEADTLNTMLSRILTDTAHVLKGTPEALHSHSWHDLAQVAAALKEKAERLHKLVRAAYPYPNKPDWCGACGVQAAMGHRHPKHAPDCPASRGFLTTSATESREAKEVDRADTP